VAAGNAFTVYGERLTGLPLAGARIHALPQAAAMLRLAPQLLGAGQAVSAEHALPTYVRDKVAQTTAERAAIKAAQAAVC
jgi:tRNA threonylcarbamoyladenosine biosynthesis protein TsaB